jgi:dTDP-glucose 4,6-dehydratase
MRLLLTGAAGFIGSNFARRIADKSFSGFESVIVLDKLTYAGVSENLKNANEIRNYKFIEGDICDSLLVSRIIKEVDAVINFAAESHVDRSIGSAAEFVETNVKGVQILMDAIRASNRNIRFIQVSTDEVYGSIDSGSWTEDSPLKPNSPYSASKASGELIARSYNRTHGLDVLITRCSNNYGTHHFPEKLIPLFVTNILEEKKLPIYGNGNNVRDWLHVDDHCRAIYQVLMNGKSGEVYNIGGGRELSNLEITGYILEIMNVDESQIVYVEDRKGHDQRYSVDWTKINRELGYVPEVDFESGLRETVNWFKANEEWWKPLKLRAGL